MARNDLATTIHRLLQEMYRQDSPYMNLIRIPSVAFDTYPAEKVLEAANATKAILQSVGFCDVQLLQLTKESKYPAVYGQLPSSKGTATTPTVLLYAHYDVQPADDVDKWTENNHKPFEPIIKNNRLYGRGAADDKSGIIIHAIVAQALKGDLPVHLKCIVEGEEETGRGSLEEYVAAHPQLFQADAIIVADGGNWKLGEPTLLTSLRGVTSLTVEVRTLKEKVHSGLFGGPIPDALMVLMRMLATLQDERGNVAVPGLVSHEWHGFEYPEEDFRQNAGILDGVSLIGDGSISSRLWTKPSINVIGLDAPSVDGATNALIDAARARVSLRVPPEQDPDKACQLLAQHLKQVAPWHATVNIETGPGGKGLTLSDRGPAYQIARQVLFHAFQKNTIITGSGGSIPLINVLAKTFPQAEIIIWGAEEPEARIHAANESVDLTELERITLAEALFLQQLGQGQVSQGKS